MYAEFIFRSILVACTLHRIYEQKLFCTHESVIIGARLVKVLAGHWYCGTRVLSISIRSITVPV